MGDYLETTTIMTKVTINYGNNIKTFKYIKRNQTGIINIKDSNLDKIHIQFEIIKNKAICSDYNIEEYNDDYTEAIVKKLWYNPDDIRGTDKIWRHLPEWFYMYDIEVLECDSLDKLYIYYTDEAVYAKVDTSKREYDESNIKLVKRLDDNQNKIRWSYICNRCTKYLLIMSILALIAWFVVLPGLANLPRGQYSGLFLLCFFGFYMPLIMTKDYIVETNKRYKKVLQAPPTKDIVPLELDVLKD